MRKILITFAAFPLLFSLPAFAGSGNSEVSVRSGNQTENVVVSNNEAVVKINQNANVRNDVDVTENTGHNEANGNDVENGEAAVAINTGNADAEVKIENKVNTANVSVGEKEEEEGESPAEEEVPEEGVAAAEEAVANIQESVVAAGEGGGVLAAEELPESGMDSVTTAALLSGILFFALYDLKKLGALKAAGLI
jgi:hypothetical protein